MVSPLFLCSINKKSFESQNTVAMIEDMAFMFFGGTPSIAITWALVYSLGHRDGTTF